MNLFLLLLFFALADSAPGQVAVPSGVPVTGTVIDPHKAGVLGAKVTLSKAGGPETVSTTADENGTFRFDAVAPGNYGVRIEREGFKVAVARVRVDAGAVVETVSSLHVRQDLHTSNPQWWLGYNPEVLCAGPVSAGALPPIRERE